MMLFNYKAQQTTKSPLRDHLAIDLRPELNQKLQLKLTHKRTFE